MQPHGTRRSCIATATLAFCQSMKLMMVGCATSQTCSGKGLASAYWLTCKILSDTEDEMNADAWHKRLVRYYSYFGFMPVREVGDSGLRDIPDLLVWGGVGQRMDASIEELLRRWTSAIRRSVPKGLN